MLYLGLKLNYDCTQGYFVVSYDSRAINKHVYNIVNMSDN